MLWEFSQQANSSGSKENSGKTGKKMEMAARGEMTEHQNIYLGSNHFRILQIANLSMTERKRVFLVEWRE